MFTGIIQARGSVERVVSRGASRRLWASGDEPWSDIRPGESIAVDGVCLTVAGMNGRAVVFDLSRETLSKTTLGALRVGDRVNLERALAVGDRVGGHFVLGHVDGVGTLISRVERGPDTYLRFRLPTALSRYLVPKGSIAVDGVSLTVAETRGSTFAVSLIPFTARHTSLGEKRIGARVNVEMDMLVKLRF